MSQLHAKQHIEIELSMDELDLTAAEKKATLTSASLSNLKVLQRLRMCT